MRPILAVALLLLCLSGGVVAADSAQDSAAVHSAFQQYLQRVVFIIRTQPNIQVPKDFDVEAVVSLHFAADGKCTGFHIVERSGFAPFDQSLTMAIQRAIAVLPPAPVPVESTQAFDAAVRIVYRAP